MSDDQHDDDLDDAPVVLRVVCTDRGEHAAARVATVTHEEWGYVTGDFHRRQGSESPVYDEGGELVDIVGRSTHTAPSGSRYAVPGSSTTSHRFRCHRCGRHLTVRDERWQGMVARLVENGVSQVDISMLDRLGC